jgi:ArsR family transcriptional regulator
LSNRDFTRLARGSFKDDDYGFDHAENYYQREKGHMIIHLYSKEYTRRAKEVMEIDNSLKSLQNLAQCYNGSVEDRQLTLKEIAEEIGARDTYRQARTLKAVADPTRLKIIKALSQHELCVCELMLLLDAQQSAVSHHLRILKDANLVVERRQGKWTFHRLAGDRLKTLLKALDELE